MSLELPLHRDSPVFYDNDDHRDVYTDEFLLALSHLGRIELKGLITTYRADREEYRLFVEGRRNILRIADRSGLKHTPQAFAGSNRKLMMPGSGNIEDTEPFGLPSSQKLIDAALETTREQPLVVITGGQLTALADAYLMEPDIADRVVVAGIFGTQVKGHNSALDGWAWTIVLSKYRVLAFPFGRPGNRGKAYMKAAEVPKRRIRDELPQDVEFFRWMYEKEHPTNRLPAEHDYDGQPVVALLRKEYVTGVRRWRVAGIRDDGDPELVRDDAGPIYEATDADQDVATETFWNTMKRLASDLLP